MVTTPNMPDVTKNQTVALVTMVVGQLIAWGVVDNGMAKIFISVGAMVFAAGLKAADAYIRGQRSKAWALTATKDAEGVYKVVQPIVHELTPAVKEAIAAEVKLAAAGGTATSTAPTPTAAT